MSMKPANDRIALEMKLPGKRIVLRQYRTADAQAIQKWRDDIETTRWMGPRFRHTRTLDETVQTIQNVTTNHDDTSVYFVIADIDTDEYIGGIDLTSIDRIDGHATLSIVVGNSDRRSIGIGTEAIELLLDHAFSEIKLHKVELRVSSGNARAIRCYSRLGFKEVGRLREHSRIDGKFYDMILMDILESEFSFF